jgi:hypothetical protein
MWLKENYIFNFFSPIYYRDMMSTDIYKNRLRLELQAKYANLLKSLQQKYNADYIATQRDVRLNALAKRVKFGTLAQKLRQDQAQLKINYDIEYKAISSIQPEVIRFGGMKKALLVGINYRNSPYELHGCINDVLNVRRHLNGIGFPNENIALLTDDIPSSLPTKANILNEFTNLLKNAESNDLICFFYSGHGSNVRDLNNDEMDGLDETIVSKDLQYITDDELRSVIQQHLKKDVTLFAMFDSCFSGTMLDLKYNYTNNMTINNRYAETDGNVLVLSGCTDRQTSAECVINNVNQGALTWAFLSSCLTSKTWRQFIGQISTSMNNGLFTQTPQMTTGRLFNLDSAFFL